MDKDSLQVHLVYKRDRQNINNTKVRYMRKVLNILLVTIFLFGIIVLAGCAPKQNQDQTSPQGPSFAGDRFPGERMGFNPEERQAMLEQAKTACQDKQENETCEVESPRGKMPGKCNLMNNTLSCRPERMNRVPGDRDAMFQQMQENAAAACQDKTEGADCAMQNPRGEMPGTCKTQEGKLMCSPEFEGRQPMQ